MGNVWKSAVSAWVGLGLLTAIGCSGSANGDAASGAAGSAEATAREEKLFDSIRGEHGRFLGQALKTLLDGRQTFRFDTFGDEAFWGGQLRLHEAVEGARLGGVGPGVSPRTALEVGL